MNSPAPAEQNRPPVTGNAFNTAQLVFANGWIDIEDLDRVCHPIANAPDEATAEQVVADLASVDKRVARQADSSAQGNPKKPTSSSARRSRKAGRLAADLVFGLLLLAFAINLLALGDHHRHGRPTVLLASVDAPPVDHRRRRLGRHAMEFP